MKFVCGNGCNWRHTTKIDACPFCKCVRVYEIFDKEIDGTDFQPLPPKEHNEQIRLKNREYITSLIDSKYGFFGIIDEAPEEAIVKTIKKTHSIKRLCPCCGQEVA